MRCQNCGSATQLQEQLAVGSYLGQVGRSATASNCHLSLVAHNKARVLPQHAHDWPFISMLLKGSYISHTRTRAFEFKRSSAVYHPRAFEHRDEIGRDGGMFLCIQLHPGLLEGAEIARRGLDDDVVLLDEYPAYLTLASLYCALAAAQDDLAYEALAAELAALIFTRDSGGARTMPRWLKHVEERLREEDPLSLSDLARDAGVHATTLTRIFRQHRRCSIGEFRAGVRARRAFLEVVGGGEPLSEVSLIAGYADQSHMTRDFRLVFGLTPGQIRSSASA